ncbi:kelch repeat-containing protein [Cystobacter fuscus]
MDKKRIVRGCVRGSLMVLALAGCGQKASSGEKAPGARSAPLTASCEARPPVPPVFEPELEWAWTGSDVMPSHTNVMMAPVVVDTNADGVPDVVFNTYAGENYISDGILRAVDGATGRELWAVTAQEHRVRGASSIAAGDIDGDGRVEICTVAQDSRGLLCFEHDGTFKFRTGGPGNNWGGPSMADLEGDGQVEIINGHAVFDHTGALKWLGSDGAGGTTNGPLSFAVDIDQDGKLEVINDRAIYQSDGQPRCVNTDIGHGLAAVANFDADPQGEVVVVWSGYVTLMDDHCQSLWTSPIPGGGVGGTPNIADFDGDGQPEIGVAGTDRYTVFEADGTVKWESTMRDHSSNRTGSSTFDFEGDGRSEIIYADEVRLRIYDGTTGAVRFEVPHSSCTAYEQPIVADVDGDHNAELLVAQNTTCGFGPFAGLRLYRDRKDGWVNTRRVWNQHAYSITHVNEDGTLPTHPATAWLSGFNSFRSNSQGSPGTSAFAAPDVRISQLTATCDATTWALTLEARVRNTGDAAASAGLRVAFYQGAPASGGQLLGVASLPQALPPAGEASATLKLTTAPDPSAPLWAVADDDGTPGAGRELECDEGNNAASSDMGPRCAPPPVRTWVRRGDLLLPRLRHEAVLLADGRVLVAGGFNRSAEVYEPLGATWSATGSTLASHRGHAMTRLVDGRVLLVGGSPRANAELYLPAHGEWRAAGLLHKLRYHPTATLLPDGRVLVIGGATSEGGGEVLGSSELYDPAHDTWSLTGTLGTARMRHTATLLPDGRVLVVGGVDGSDHPLASAEVFDPATGRFSPVSAPQVGHGVHTATLLADGRVLVVGGLGSGVPSAASAELYDPTTDAWTATGPVRTPRRAHTATLLPGGEVLVAGGYHPSTGILTAAERFDPVSNTWSDTAPLNVDRYGHTATLLGDGTVLAVGGVSNHDSASTESYFP